MRRRHGLGSRRFGGKLSGPPHDHPREREGSDAGSEGDDEGGRENASAGEWTIYLSASAGGSFRDRVSALSAGDQSVIQVAGACSRNGDVRTCSHAQ